MHTLRMAALSALEEICSYKWVIKGKYILEEGDLNSETLTILLRSDCDAWPYFEKEGEPTQPTTKPASSNPSPISPKTGSTVQYFLFALLAVIAVITGALGYKLARSKRYLKDLRRCVFAAAFLFVCIFRLFYMFWFIHLDTIVLKYYNVLVLLCAGMIK